MHTEILGVKLSKTTTSEVLEKIESFLLLEEQHYIVTLNPEMVVEAQKDEYFRKIINEADIVVPDGVGILIASRFIKGEVLPERIPGIDLICKICKADFIRGRRIYLLGAKQGIAKKAAKALAQDYDYLNIVGAEEGIPSSIFNFQFSISDKIRSSESKDQSLDCQKCQKEDSEFDAQNNSLIQRINKAKPDILFVAFGAPKQEKWIYENLKRMPSVKLAIGVGGSFDFISGNVRRAPLVFRKLGLEWLWRLILEPQRAGRIYSAVVKFGLLVLRQKYKRNTKG